MTVQFKRRARWAAALTSTLALSLGTVHAEGPWGPPCRPAPSICPPAQCPQPTAPSTRPEASELPSGPQPPASLTESALSPEQSAATEPTAFAMSAPNMIGNLLQADRSIIFGYLRAGGQTNVAANGFTSASNPKVSENNSPVPLDRVYFRYNFYENALAIAGISSAPPTINPITGAPTSAIAVKGIDVHAFTFGFEKTFFEQRASLELRVPFSNTLASNLNLSAGDVTGPVGGTDRLGNPLFNTVGTPQNTFGHEDVEFGDMTLILKAALFQTPTWTFTAGAALGIPTGPDTNVHVTDFGGGVGNQFASIIRDRDFHVNNETWSLSPYFAVLATPSERWFFQGFMQFEFPLNNDGIHFSDRFTTVSGTPPNLGGFTIPGRLTPPFTATGSVEDQILMHIDAGVGYWLMRCPNASWITGIAPSLELHYTTTLENAQIVTLPGDIANQGTQLEPPPQVGNQRNRVDILDMTVGTTFLIGNRTSLATAVSFPLRTGDNRVYDWEFHLQLNYYFGARSATMY